MNTSNHRRLDEGVIFCAVHVLSKEDKQLVKESKAIPVTGREGT
jgi:hypothetical protein